jgi:hypothetical protein
MWCPSLTEITKCTMWSDYMCSMPLYFITNCQLHVQNVQYKSMWLCQTWSSHYDYIVYSIADHLYRWGQGNKTDSRPPIETSSLEAEPFKCSAFISVCCQLYCTVQVNVVMSDLVISKSRTNLSVFQLI